MHEKPTLLELYQDDRPFEACFPKMDCGELGWRPAVDVQDLPDAVVVRAALPGVATSDISVHLCDGVLLISGRRRAAQGGGWVTQELHAGPFSRAVPLPEATNGWSTLASRHEDGILEVRLPKELGPGKLSMQ